MINDDIRVFDFEEMEKREEQNSTSLQQQQSDYQEILIERDEDSTQIENGKVAIENSKSINRKKIFKVFGVIVAALLVVSALAYAGWRYYYHNYYVGMPVSCSSSENIQKLQSPSVDHRKPGVIFTHDSVDNVVLNMYEIHGLKAELTYNEPDTTDADVYLYSRCADYDKKGHILGSMVIDGKEISDDNSRLGYCAMVGNKTVIGIARDEKVKDYVEENGGSMFRQFILVSDGEIPRVFHLHKKVERRALARMDDQLYYIESCNAETMWDFADAIRKYGFIDAIYITGGDAPSFYRTEDGQRHPIGNWDNYKKQNCKYDTWIVFKKK